MRMSNIYDTTIIHIIDDEKDHIIRFFSVKDPVVFLKQYKFMEENDIPFFFCEDEDEDKVQDLYVGMWGDIVFIEVTPGGKATLPCIKVYVKVRDYL